MLSLGFDLPLVAVPAAVDFVLQQLFHAVVFGFVAVAPICNISY
jgi:hypothetical protein